MNKHCYRIVFNKLRGLLMAVAETVMSRGKALGTGVSEGCAAWSKARFGAVRMLSVAIWSALGLVTWIDTSSAQIVADRNAPANQQATILNAANGVPLVNIQTPSAAGVSRNTYSQFDVQQQGAILNNSVGNVQTQLGGWVQGNPWLAAGSARVILNEVNSSNPSLLRGYVEVAGSRAQVVIANPSGVSCDGCGFINASRSTLTTGTPIVNNGSLEGYRVQGGAISITGAGMDASTSDYTDLIARSVQVNAGIWANKLAVTVGANQVNADNTQAVAIQGTGVAPTIGIDVAQLGGMYAGKIILVGTEAGVGVRNAGQIGASAGDIVVTANGRLENTGSITSVQALNINVAQDIQNQQGTLAANQNVTLNAASIDNTQGLIGSAQGAVSVTANSGAVNNTTGRIVAASAMTVSAQGVNNAGGTLSGGQLSLNSQSQAINNEGGTIAATGVNGGDGTLDIQSGALNNNTGLISAQGALSINTNGQTLVNTNTATTGGIIGQSTVALITDDLNNQAGYIGSAGNLSINSHAIDNSQSGVVSSDANLDIVGTSLNNASGLLHSGQSLAINADSIDNSNTSGSNQGIEGDVVALTANTIGNQSGAIRSNTSTTLTSGGAIDNTQGTISSTGTIAVQDANLASKSLAVTNTGGTLIAGQQLSVDSASLSGDGNLLSQGDLAVKVDADLNQSGQLLANGTATVQTAGTLTNTASMLAGTALNVTAATINNETNGEMAANAVSLNATSSHTLNNRGLINGSDTFIDTITLNNLGTGRIYGDHVAISADSVTNAAENGIAPVIAARSRLDIGANSITNSEDAMLFSAGDLAIGGSLDSNHQATGQAAVLNNSSATIEALGNLDIAASQINNNNLHLTTADVVTGSQGMTEYQGSGSGNRYAAGTPDVYTYVDESVHLHTPEGNFEQWTQYNYTRTTTQTVVQSTDPGKILSGGNMNITADTLNNNDSTILAGGNLTGNVTSLNNVATQGTLTTTDSGTATSYWRNQKKGTDDTGSSSAAYQPAPSIQSISLTTTAYQGNSASAVTGNTAPSISAVTGTHNTTPIAQVSQPNSDLSVRTGGINASLPNNSLFQYQSTPGSHYLIATDPAYANYKTWLSSDYMLNALSLDPALMQTRLGDGFYEQRLVNEQVAQLTGNRYLAGYTDDQSEYQALMNNGVTVAQSLQLTPGVALTAAQMAALTSDIVWLVSQTVTLPNGQTTQALVPQVYVHVKDGDLQPSGSLIAGNNVNLNVANNLVNSGTIAGQNLAALTAQNVQNLNGRITGNNVTVQAMNDLNNIGGVITAANSLTATAGHDLNIISTTSTQTGAQGTTTNINSVAGLSVTGSNGTLIAAAGHDMNVNGAIVSNGDGSGTGAGTTTLVAGNDINLGTVTQGNSHNIVWDSKNQRQDSTTVQTGSTIQTQGDLTLQTGQDINAQGASITSNAGAAQLLAGRDINLTTAQTTQAVDEAHQHKGKSGWFSSKTITTRDTLDQTTAQGTTVSGNTTVIAANHDLNLTGSNAVSTAGTSLSAGTDINVAAATNTVQQSHLRDEKTSGLFSGGGIGVTLGMQQQTTTQNDVQTTASASTVGSTNGNVNLAAGNRYTQTGSDIIAPQGDINITAKQVNIEEARNTDTNTVETKFKQSGLTLALTSPVISAIQTANQMKQASSQTSDGRMQILAAATTGLAAKSAVDAVQSNPSQAGGVNLSLSIGASQSKSTVTETSNTAAGSTVAAGNNVNISAAGAGQDSNLTIQGSNVTAGNNINLQADNQINLQAAANTDSQHSTNNSSSASLGISIGTSGFLVTASASGGRGNADGTDQNWTNTHVTAGDQLVMQSGGDTNIKGAVASGSQVTTNVGGNLNIESLQDTSQYDSKQQSIGGSISVGMGMMGGSLSLSNSKINSDYASVSEQSGIKTGDQGFNVNVAGNTDLKGGAITSTQAAVDSSSNSFTTGSLSTSDIQNHASYDAHAIGVGLGAGVNTTGKYQLSGTGAGVGSDSGNASSTTQAAISGIAGNKDARTGDKETGIQKIFDADKVQKEINAQVTITQAFGVEAHKALDSYVESTRKNLQEQLKNASTDIDRAAIQKDLSDLRLQEQALNILIGAVSGTGEAAVTKEALSTAADQMRQLMIKDSQTFAGVTDGTTKLTNDTGVSNGVRDDGHKVGGTRIDLDLLCGAGNQRCVIQKDTDGNPVLDANGNTQLALNSKGQVQFIGSLADFLKTDDGQKLAGATGGIQGAPGTLFGYAYQPGSWQDKLIEAFSGTHDYVGGKLSGLYDDQGNATRGRSDTEITAQNTWSASGAIVVSTPFAMSEFLSPQAWQAISILLKAAQ
jgi:filamentous hemagglutinin